MKIKPFNIIDCTELPVAGDPLKIEKEMYYVCGKIFPGKDGFKRVGVIPRFESIRPGWNTLTAI